MGQEGVDKTPVKDGIEEMLCLASLDYRIVDCGDLRINYLDNNRIDDGKFLDIIVSGDLNS